MEILLATHGSFAKGILESLDMIMPLDLEIETICLNDDGIEEFKKEINEYLDMKTDVLVLVDLFGGTPFNACYEYKCKNPDRNINIISGFNFPMLIQVAFHKNANTLSMEVIDDIINQSTEGIKWIK